MAGEGSGSALVLSELTGATVGVAAAVGGDAGVVGWPRVACGCCVSLFGEAVPHGLLEVVWVREASQHVGAAALKTTSLVWPLLLMWLLAWAVGLGESEGHSWGPKTCADGGCRRKAGQNQAGWPA